MGEPPHSRFQSLRFYLMGVVAALTVAGCSSIVASPAPMVGLNDRDPPSSHCQHVFAAIGNAVESSGTRDAEAHPVAGFAYLRVNRFLARLGRRFEGRAIGPDFAAWVDRMQALAAEAREIEIENLPNTAVAGLAVEISDRSAGRPEIMEAAATCAVEMRRRQLSSPDQRRALVSAAEVPDHYSDLARTAGLFPLTSIPVAAGWKKWKEDNLAAFSTYAADREEFGPGVSYAPPRLSPAWSPAKVRKILRRSRNPRLSIPEPSDRDAQWLLQAFAPVWRIDGSADYDRPGHPRWTNEASTVAIDTGRATVFSRIGHAVIGGRALLQLSYAVWFTQRPGNGPVDLLAGRLDGVIWRVTLGEDGHPLLYDSIHACGCYHLVFPVPARHASKTVAPPPDLLEPPAILEGPDLRRGRRIVLHLASGSHYLTGITQRRQGAPGPDSHAYRLADARILRSLPLPDGGRRSMFGPDGIVAGSERLEAALLWPTGVNSPGAMRQWGTHAIALTGRRHFDDPIMLARVLGW